MIGFQQLNEATTKTYNHYPARSTKAVRHVVIDMEGEAKDVVVTFTVKTKTGLGDRKKRSWFCTVSAMRGKKGGLSIREMGDQQKFQETLVAVVQEFMLQVRANAVNMRVQKKGSGKMFDMRIKTLFKKLRYPCETTKILNVGEHEVAEDYSFFVITKPGYNADQLLESDNKLINDLAAMMATEDDYGARKSIIVTSDMVPGFEEYHDNVKSRWIEESPARKVTDLRAEIPAPVPKASNPYRGKLEEFATEYNTQRVRDLARTALGTLDMNLDLPSLSKRLAPLFDNLRDTEKTQGAHIARNALQSHGRALESSYDQLKMSLMQNEQWSSMSMKSTNSLSSYTGSQYGKVNDLLLTGEGSERHEEMVHAIDDAFSVAGMNASNVRPAPVLYRGASMPATSIKKILETGIWASTAFMSTSLDPMIAVDFADTHADTILRTQTQSKQDMIYNLVDGSNVNVIFIIESEGLPVLIPGNHGQSGESEFIVNRNTVFDATVLQMNEGYDAIIRLKVRDAGAYNESILSVYQTSERIDELSKVADVLRMTAKPEENVSLKYKSPVTV